MYAIRITSSLSIVCTICLHGCIALTGFADSVTSDQVIDGASALNGNQITVSDGIEGPTTVHLVSGGQVAGFNLLESSHLIVDGGTVTYLSSLEDESTLTIYAGSFGCSETICQAIDYNSFINASGNSSIEIRGGQGIPTFSLQDNSSLTIFGSGLSATDPALNNDFTVAGTFPDGTSFSTRVSASNGASQILLIEVPEPTSFTLLVVSLGMFTTRNSRSK